MRRVRLRPEVGGVALLLAVLSPVWSAHWLAAVVIHELGHGVLGLGLAGRTVRFDLQLGAADAYSRPDDPPSVRGVVVGFGLLVSLAYAATLTGLGFDGSAAWAWLAYQAFVFPASDGGVVIRDALTQMGWGPLRAFRRVQQLALTLAVALLAGFWVADWMFGFAVGLGLTALALVMAQTERPALVHVEAYRAWSEGRVEDVFRWADRIGPGSRVLSEHVRELAVRAALDAGRLRDVERYGTRLPPSHPARLEAAERLLDASNDVDGAGANPAVRPGAEPAAVGARWAEDALDDYERAPTRWDPGRQDRLRGVLVRFALYESRGGRMESAAGLLERAAALGPVAFDWISYAAGGAELLAHPRVRPLLPR